MSGLTLFKIYVAIQWYNEIRSYLFFKQLQVPSVPRYYCPDYPAKNGSLDLVFPSIPIENGSLDLVFPSMQAKKMT